MKTPQQMTPAIFLSKHSVLNNAAESLERSIGFVPAVEALFDRREQFAQRGKEPSVRGQPASALPDPLERRQLRAVWRQEQEREDPAVFPQPRLQPAGMVVGGIVQHDDHACAARAMSLQLFQEGLACHGIELLTHRANELAVAQADRAKAGH
jgi:hypothetical protein